MLFPEQLEDSPTLVCSSAHAKVIWNSDWTENKKPKIVEIHAISNLTNKDSNLIKYKARAIVALVPPKALWKINI